MGGLLLSTTADQRIVGYGTSGLVGVGLAALTLFWVGRLQGGTQAKEPVRAVE